jgi:flagellar motor switch protein FliM
MNKKIALLKSELKLMNDASSILEYSYKKCLKIKLNDQFTFKELDAFENLSSRFARLSDIVIQKVLKTIHTINLDDITTVRDSINAAEKMNLIKSARLMIEMRELRNSIVHEYMPDAIKSIFISILRLTPHLQKDIKLINLYCEAKYPEEG